MMDNNSEITGKMMPHNMEAEQSLLGSLLIDKDAIIKITELLTSDDFYSEKHAVIYQALLDIYAKREPIDLLSLSNTLTEKNQLDFIGGRSYLVNLTNIVPSSSHVVNYAKIIQKKAILRRLIQASAEITEYGYREEEEVDTLLDQAEQRLFSISQKYLKHNFVSISDVLVGTFDRIDEIHREKGKLRGVPSGFKDLDNCLAGFQKSDLIVIAARPSVGKTSLALDFARVAAIQYKVPVGLFSLEMSKEQLVDRLLCAQGNIDLWKMRTGKLMDSPEQGQDDFSKINYAMGILSEAPIFIDDSPMLNVMSIRSKARRLQMEHGLGMIIIDYLQLMEGRNRSGDNRVQEITEITRALKAVARELNIPVIALSQLARAVELSKPAIPKLAHLRESGSIEQDADVVMFIYRKSTDRNYRREDLSPEEAHTAEIHIAKHRNGPTGMVKVFFDESRSSFRNLDRQHSAPENI